MLPEGRRRTGRRFVQTFDWICFVVLAVSVLLGAWRGLLYEAFSIVAWIVAFFIARWAADPVGRLLPLGDAGESVRYAVGFALVFILAAFAGGLAAAMARRAARALGVRLVDRTFGMIFGLARGLLLLLLVAVVVQLGGLSAEPWWRDSWSGPLLQATVQDALPVLPENFARHLAV